MPGGEGVAAIRSPWVDGRLEEGWLGVAGWEGIVDVAKARGASGLLDYEPDAFIFDPYRFAVGDGSEHEVRALLEHVASTDPDVGSYLAAVDKWLHREAAVRSAPVRRAPTAFSLPPIRPWCRVPSQR